MGAPSRPLTEPIICHSTRAATPATVAMARRAAPSPWRSAVPAGRRQARRLLQRKIAGRPGVGMPEAGEEIDVSGPRSDAMQRGECRVRHLRRYVHESRQIDFALGDRTGDRFQRADLRPDSPSRASRAGRARKIAAGSNGSIAAISRPQIALALAVESCCETIIAASPGETIGSPPQRRPAGLGDDGAKRGSMAPSAARPASRSASV